MNVNTIKAGAFAPKIQVAAPTNNADAIISAIRKADDAGLDLLCLPELILTGCTCDDLFFQPTLINASASALQRIMRETADCSVITVFGMPIMSGSSLYDCAVVIRNGEIFGVVPNTAANPRYFSNTAPEAISIQGIGRVPVVSSIGCGIIAFAVTFGAESDMNLPFPSIECRLDSSIEILGSANARREKLRAKKKTILYANSGLGESTTDFVYSGHCLIFDNGELAAECKPFENTMAIAQVKETLENSEPASCETEYRGMKKRPFIPEAFSITQAKEIIQILAHGLAHRAAEINAQSFVLGVSGGLDSTLALIVSLEAAKIMGKNAEFVHALSMPCFGTSNRTRENTKKLCAATGVRFETIDLTESVTQHLKEIRHDISNKNVVFENAQARMRTLVLMDIANGEGGLVVGTGDLSESALGFCTYNGDHMSMYGVNGSIPKTLMQAIIKAIADDSSLELREALCDILETPISPELLPGDNGNIVQFTQKLIGSYELNDFFIFHALYKNLSPKSVYELALDAFADDYSPDEIKKWLKSFYKRFFASQFKRSCSPDGPQATVLSLSPRKGLFMPSEAKCAEWIREIEDSPRE